MKKRPSKQKRIKAALPRRNRRTLVTVIVLVLSTVAASFALTRFRTAWRAPEPTPVVQSGLTLAKEYIYAGGRLIATEEPGGGTSVTAPTAVVATAASGSQVIITWTASTGPVSYYQVERRQNVTGSFTLLSPNVTTTSFTDSAVSSGIAYQYRVRAFDAQHNPSPYSNIDLATAITFIDDPLQAGVTIVKAQHLTELRQAVNAVRATANLAAATWTDPSPASVVIKAVHITELRTNLDQALTALSIQTQPYTDSPLTAGTIVKRVHVEELRQRVK